ncbi:hypothetical protein ACVKN3_001693 [Luteibacter sp. PvP120]
MHLGHTYSNSAHPIARAESRAGQSTVPDALFAAPSAAEAMSESYEIPTALERTLYEVGLNLEYSIRLHYLHRRLFERVRKIGSFLAVLSGTAVVGLLKSESPVLSFVLGLIVTLLGLANLVWDFGGIARAHEGQRKAYNALLISPRTTVAEADRARAEIAADAPLELESLRCVALNDTYRTFGHTDMLEPEGWLSRWMRRIA